MKQLDFASCELQIVKSEKGRAITPKRVARILLGQVTPKGFALRRLAVPA